MFIIIVDKILLLLNISTLKIIKLMQCYEKLERLSPSPPSPQGVWSFSSSLKREIYDDIRIEIHEEIPEEKSVGASTHSTPTSGNIQIPIHWNDGESFCLRIVFSLWKDFASFFNFVFFLLPNYRDMLQLVQWLLR